MTNEIRGPLSGSELSEFVSERMQMTSYYQPLLIAALIEAGGTASVDDLARILMLGDTYAVQKSRRVLMRWPKMTLERHGVIRYNRSEKAFALNVNFDNDAQIAEILDLCKVKVSEWEAKISPKEASGYFAAIESAGGRCEACGIPGFARPLDVDHIVPQSQAVGGKVKSSGGQLIPVNDLRNLQVLCSKCNRGKRDTSTYDFRPSEERLAETIMEVFAKADELGIANSSLMETVQELITSQVASRD